MNKYYFFLTSLFLCVSCDDGDIITTKLDFEDSFDSCGDIVFFKTREKHISFAQFVYSLREVRLLFNF